MKRATILFAAFFLLTASCAFAQSWGTMFVHDIEISPDSEQMTDHLDCDRWHRVWITHQDLDATGRLIVRHAGTTVTLMDVELEFGTEYYEFLTPSEGDEYDMITMNTSPTGTYRITAYWQKGPFAE